MKLTFYGIFIQCLMLNFLFASEINAQEQVSVKDVFISLKLQNASLNDVFQQIENQTDFTFSYDLRHIEDKVPINVNAINKSVGEILLEISEQADLKFKQVNNNINVETLSPKNRKAKKLEIIIQTRTITGKVTSFEDNEGIPGVNVLEKGTNNGTVTDVQGNYSLEVSEGATIVFSSVGYTTEEVEVGSRSVIDLSMMQDLKQLQELVVIGYGQERRKDLSGSVASVDAKTIQETPNVSFEQAMQGRIAGVQITTASNAPGGGISVRIRGGNSISASNEPLYVVDGVQINADNNAISPGGSQEADFVSNDLSGNALASLNPNDIASIEVLKDASATAIYGSRGSNGVVLITTKSGTAGKNNVSYETFFALQEPATRYDVMNGEQYLQHYQTIVDERVADNPSFPSQIPDGFRERFANVDWQDEMFNPSLMQNHQLSFTGGNKNLSYNAAVNYFDQDGVVEGTGFERYTARLNMNGNINDQISFGNNFTFTHSNREAGIVNGNGFRLNDFVMSALQSPPIVPVRDANGFFTVTPRNWQDAIAAEIGENLPLALPRNNNPLLQAEEVTNNISTNRILGNVFGEYEFFEGLTARVSVGGDFTDAVRDYYIPSTLRASNNQGLAVTSTVRNISWINTNTLTYKRIQGENSLTILGGLEVQQNVNKRLSAEGFNFFTDAFDNNQLSAAESFLPPRSSLEEWSLVSTFARINYIHNDKYIFTATGRADGSSRFGANNRWGFFPSGAVAWRVSEEDFLKGNTTVSNLKLRVSYGLTGNTDIGAYRSLTTFDPNPNNAYIFGGVASTGTVQSNIANPDLRWEKTAQLNVGLDIGLISDRVSITADYYIKTTEDLLLAKLIPASTGFTNSLQNVGSIENRGLELSLNSINIQTNRFTWTMDANITFNRSEVLALGDESQLTISSGANGRLRTNDNVLLRVGEEVGVFYGQVFDGIWLNQAEIDAATVDHGNPAPGSARYVDTNGDGQQNADDRTIIGNPNPDFIYGLNNRFAYGNFDLSIFLQGTQGNDMMNITRADLLYMGAGGRENKMTQVLTAWRSNATDEENRGTDVARRRRSQNEALDTRIIEDGSFLRVRNIMLGYTLNTASIPWLQNLRLYGSVQNLATFTNYSGFDPDVNVTGQNSVARGIDFVGLPLVRSYTFGINVTF